MKIIVKIIFAFLISCPLTLFAALLLTPILPLLEKVTGFALTGHSGPSSWAIINLFVVIFLVLLLMIFFKANKKDARDDSGIK